jgi:hypothetical protein
VPRRHPPGHCRLRRAGAAVGSDHRAHHHPHRPHNPAVRGGLVSRRHPPGHRRRGRGGAAVGPDHRAHHHHPHRRHRRSVGAGLVPRRHPPGHRQRDRTGRRRTSSAPSASAGRGYGSTPTGRTGALGAHGPQPEVGLSVPQRPARPARTARVPTSPSAGGPETAESGAVDACHRHGHAAGGSRSATRAVVLPLQGVAYRYRACYRPSEPPSVCW